MSCKNIVWKKWVGIKYLGCGIRSKRFQGTKWAKFQKSKSNLYINDKLKCWINYSNMVSDTLSTPKLLIRNYFNNRRCCLNNCNLFWRSQGELLICKRETSLILYVNWLRGKLKHVRCLCQPCRPGLSLNTTCKIVNPKLYSVTQNSTINLKVLVQKLYLIPLIIGKIIQIWNFKGQRVTL